jgi:hypothetical protein
VYALEGALADEVVGQLAAHVALAAKSEAIKDLGLSAPGKM